MNTEGENTIRKSDLNKKLTSELYERPYKSRETVPLKDKLYIFDKRLRLMAITPQHPEILSLPRFLIQMCKLFQEHKKSL
jgi:hypothetical protein